MAELRDIAPMVIRSIANPSEGAEEILSLGVPRHALGSVVALVVILSVLTGYLAAVLAGGQMAGGALMQRPLAMAGLQGGVLLITAVAVDRIGRAFGGTGRFPEALLLIAWLQFIMVCTQVLQLVAFLIVPPLGALLGFVALGLFLYLLTNFVAAMHGFRSRAKVFGGIIVSGFLIGFVLTMILAAFGISVAVAGGSL